MQLLLLRLDARNLMTRRYRKKKKMNLKKKPGGQRQPQRKDKGTEKERKTN